MLYIPNKYVVTNKPQTLHNMHSLHVLLGLTSDIKSKVHNLRVNKSICCTSDIKSNPHSHYILPEKTWVTKVSM